MLSPFTADGTNLAGRGGLSVAAQAPMPAAQGEQGSRANGMERQTGLP